MSAQKAAWEEIPKVHFGVQKKGNEEAATEAGSCQWQQMASDKAGRDKSQKALEVKVSRF